MNQLLNPISLLPRVSEEPTSSVAVLYGGSGNTGWIAYEIARDFLSAPRLFAVVELMSLSLVELDSQYEYEGVEYLEDGNMSERGWFEVEPSPLDKSERETHLLLSTQKQRYEFVCKAFSMQARVYHQTSAQTALLQWMAQR